MEVSDKELIEHPNVTQALTAFLSNIYSFVQSTNVGAIMSIPGLGQIPSQVSSSTMSYSLTLPYAFPPNWGDAI